MKTRFAPTVLALALLAPLAAWSQISISIGIAPPPLPVYRQPPVPGDGYLWTPGYWAWNGDDRDYYWVPGTWVLAPTPGFLWTPGYWGYGGGGYRWNVGYWGPRVGFYGGISYGHGYNGRGYDGGRWERGAFHYNTAVNNVNTTVVRNVYKTTVVTNNTYNVKRVSYNGGNAGVRAAPTPDEEKVRHEKHIDATPNQVEHERTAMKTPTQKASVNHGAPQVAATPKPAAFDAPEAVKASNKTVAAKSDRPATGDSAPKQQRSAQGSETQGASKSRSADVDAGAKDPQGTPPAGKQNKASQRPPAAHEEAPPHSQKDAADKDNGKGGAPVGATQSPPDTAPQAKERAPKESKPAHAEGDPAAKDKDKTKDKQRN